jgi:exonuclease VII small subunit
VEYIHKRYRKMMDHQYKEFKAQIDELQEKVKKLRRENLALEALPLQQN